MRKAIPRAVQFGPFGRALTVFGGGNLRRHPGNGSSVVITMFRIPPFIATRAGMQVASGLASIVSRDALICEVPDSFAWLGRDAGRSAIPRAVVLMLALYAGAHLLMSRMADGRSIYAVGGNVKAAGISGIAAVLPDKIKKHGWRDVLRSLGSWRAE